MSLFDDDLWGYVVDDLDESLAIPYARHDGEVYTSIYGFSYDGEVLRIINRDTGAIFEVRQISEQADHE